MGKKKQGYAHIIGIISFPLLALTYFLTDSALVLVAGLIVIGFLFYKVVFQR